MMNDYKKILVSGAIGLLTSGAAVAAPLTIEDYCDPKLTAPKGVKEMTPLNDGLSYAAVSDDGRSVEVYSYKTESESPLSSRSTE